MCQMRKWDDVDVTDVTDVTKTFYANNNAKCNVKMLKTGDYFFLNQPKNICHTFFHTRPLKSATLKMMTACVGSCGPKKIKDKR